MNELMVAPVSMEAQATERREAQMLRSKASRRWWLFCGAMGLLSVWRASPASADATPATTSATSTTASYDQLIDEAVQAYEAGRFAEARTSFRRAHELMPTARTLRTIGMCSFNLGDYTDAVYSFENALLDERKPLTEEQQKHAKDLIARANRRIGRFRLRLVPEDATLTVDGRPAVLLGQSELLLEAGHHAVEARSPGYQPAHSSLIVDGGDRTRLVFELTPDAYAATQPSQVTRENVGAPGVLGPEAISAASKPNTTLRTLGYVSLGLGAASLVGFGVVGALALSEIGRLDDRCPDQRCTADYREDVDRYETLRTASTVTLIAGGALAVLGVTLLVVQPSTERAHATASITPVIGLGSIGVRGRL